MTQSSWNWTVKKSEHTAITSTNNFSSQISFGNSLIIFTSQIVQSMRELYWILNYELVYLKELLNYLSICLFFSIKKNKIMKHMKVINQCKPVWRSCSAYFLNSFLTFLVANFFMNIAISIIVEISILLWCFCHTNIFR